MQLAFRLGILRHTRRRIEELMLDGTEKSQAAKSAEQKAESATADRDGVYAEGFQAGMREIGRAHV